MSEYPMRDGFILIDGEPLTYAQLQNRIGQTETDLRNYRDAMAQMREHLTLEQANARYATDVQTAWANMMINGKAR